MLKNLLDPKSIAIIGASREKGKLGNDVMKNILESGFLGEVFPVNPKAEEILGKKCFKSVKEIKNKVDLAVIVVPAKIVLSVLEECGQAGILAAIVISSGFKEIGVEGEKLEKKLVEIAKKYKISLLGPNCLGIINVNLKLNATFADGLPLLGKVSLISQSGALAVAMLDLAKRQDLGFSKVISLGNKAVLSENEILEYLEQDDETKVIAMYLESISFGKKFMEIAKRITAKKPIIAIKSGKSEHAMKAITFHTGALASSDDAVEAAFKQSGIIRVEEMEELFNVSKAFSWQPRLLDKNIAIITNAGGMGVLAADEIEGMKIKLAELSSEIVDKLRTELPKAASLENPIDLIGDARGDRYELALKNILADKNVGGAIVILTPQTMTDVENIAKIIVKLNKEFNNKPILCSFIGGEKVKSGIKILEDNRVPNYAFPEEAVRVMNYLYREYAQMPDGHEFHKSGITDGVDRVKGLLQNKKLIIGQEALDIFKNYGMPVVESGLAKNLDEGLKIAETITYPLVLKIISEDIIKKTDVGGVKAGIKNKEEFKLAWHEIMNNIKLKKPNAKIDGFLIQKMILDGEQIIMGVKRDVSFGHLVVFGLGGIFTEVLKDVVFRIAPIDKKEAMKMIFEIKGKKVLEGVRGRKAVDVDAIANCLVKLSRLVNDFPRIEQIDINPYFAREKGGIIVDGRILLNSTRL